MKAPLLKQLKTSKALMAKVGNRIEMDDDDDDVAKQEETQICLANKDSKKQEASKRN